MGPLSIIQRYVFGGMSVVLLALSIWAVRIDGLRGKHLRAVDQTVAVLDKAGIANVSEANLPQAVELVAAARDKARAERDTARTLVDMQTQSIEHLQAESAAAAREAEANRKLAAAAIQQRDIWIARAKAASTRTERLSAEQEVQQCEQVLDQLYSSGF